jgi:16S rRNA (adenine1518-N6/adenine1519-N6)-dimethyltransferase
LIPNKALGQHFLTNQKVINKIISVIQDELCKNIVEIGPGKGAFTFNLGRISDFVLAIEKDPSLYEYLKKVTTEGKHTGIELINADILTLNLTNRIKSPLSIFGSLPYNKSKEIILNFLFLRNPRPKNLFFIVQKEVALKYLKKPPYNNYYSAITQLTSTPKRLFEITPGSFTPAPKVESILIKFDLRELGTNSDKIAKFVKILHRQPRKTVRNNINKQLETETSQEIEIILDKRPSELTIEEIERLFLLYNKEQ